MPKMVIRKTAKRRMAEVALHAALAFSLTVIGGLAATALVSTHRKIAVVDTWRYDFRWILVAATATMVAWVCLVVLSMLREADRLIRQGSSGSTGDAPTTVIPQVHTSEAGKPKTAAPDNQPKEKGPFRWRRGDKPGKQAPQPVPAAKPGPSAVAPAAVQPGVAEEPTVDLHGQNRRAMSFPGAAEDDDNA